MEDSKIKKQNKGLRFLIVLILMMVGILVGTLTGLYLANSKEVVIFKSSQKSTAKNEPNVESKKNDETIVSECEEKEEITLTGTYTGRYDRGNGFQDSITLTFNGDGTVSLNSGDGAAVIEFSEGTYTIKDNRLNYTRIYGLGDNEDNLVRISTLDNTHKFSPDIENNDTLEEFIYDKDNDTITTSTYFKKARNRDEQIILKK